MASHFKQLEYYLPNLSQSSILDVGSGRGKFLIEAARMGARVTGVETHPPYIELSRKKAEEALVTIDVVEGRGEALAFPPESFDFVNLSEVYEHVEDPLQVLKEVYRVLKPGGQTYISVPNRFGMKDQHFHLWFLNWMPRSWAERYISFRKCHKDYSLTNGRQRISEMHYGTYRELREKLEAPGFMIEDMRKLKLEKRGLAGIMLKPIYMALRPFWFDSFHLLLTKRA